ncbi:MAG TPA: hypothetical protein VNN73_00490 [Blastocatellia bacterium]|nr:hypothetical protein [Blastocatellia bacterium]
MRTDASRRYKKEDSATVLIWKTLMIGEKNFRKLNKPEMMKEVYEGAIYAGGIIVKDDEKEAAA